MAIRNKSIPLLARLQYCLPELYKQDTEGILGFVKRTKEGIGRGNRASTVLEKGDVLLRIMPKSNIDFTSVGLVIKLLLTQNEEKKTVMGIIKIDLSEIKQLPLVLIVNQTFNIIIYLKF